ncbi:MAG: DUF1801 domain-containing protein [Acidimicrobiia bacterium]
MPKSVKPKLLSGGNPQIEKGYGQKPIDQYIKALPEWKSKVGKQLDELITENIANVVKAVKWNSPFYGVKGQGWLISFHAFNKFIKLTFFTSTSLKPVPPGGARDDGRWINIYEDGFDEKQIAKWIKQSAKLQGWSTSDIDG